MHADQATHFSTIIVGSRGYIGGRLMELYQDRNEPQIVGVNSSECDFRDEASIERYFSGCDLKGASLIFLSVINKSVRNSYASFGENVSMAGNLARLSRTAGLKSIIYFSSADVYGIQPPSPILETTRIEPDNWYGLSKYTSEWTLLQSGESACPITVLRIPGIYGYGKHDRSVIGKMVRSIESTHSFMIQGTGKNLRDYVFIEDLFHIVQKLLPLRYHGVINVATGRPRSIKEIALSVARELGIDAQISYEPELGRSFDLTFDISRLRALLPDFQFSDLATGIRSYLAPIKTERTDLCHL